MTSRAKSLRLSGSSFLLVAGLALLPACGHKPESNAVTRSELPVAQVRVQTAESKPQTINEEVVGTVRAKLRAILEAKVSGRIDQLPVVLGQKVKAGQLVAHLDAAEIKARLDQAQASQDQSERDWQRASALLAGQAMTRSDYEAAESRKQVATAALAEAQAIMGYVEITAPFEGVVTKKWADRGDLATPGKPLIEIEDPAELQLEADVPEAIASRVKAEARLAVQVDSASGELIGTVREIAPTADPASRTFRVKMDLSPPAGLSAGQFARLIVPVGETSSLRVPLSAVVQRGQLEIVFSVTNERARLHLVKTGKRSGAEIEILSGLKTGVTVVVGGAEQLADGQAVAAK